MRKYSIVILILIFGLYSGLVSCDKTDSIENSLVGIWKSTKIDTLVQYIKPVKPETFRSYEYLNRVLAINADGSFQLVESKDTITGTWNQSKSDSLIVTTNRIHGKYYYDSKIEFVDKNNLIISYSYGQGYSEISAGYSVEENTLYDIKFHYIRK
ncbi:MAG TPA: hypothetical protein VJY41_02665 [Prolixibacteraceae bacterium]|nr:hypothetical protein [Prolixibacteraceae bacterium]